MMDPFFRLLLAVLGGLAASRLCGAMLAFCLPMAKPDATALAILLTFVLFSAAGIWAFAASTIWRAVLGLAIPAAFCAGILFMLHRGGVS